MIIYLASYPRSGNFWLQSIIANQFGFLTCNIHPTDTLSIEKLRKRSEQYYDIEVISIADPEFMSGLKIPPGCFFNYQVKGLERNGLRTGFGRILINTEVRKRLAAADEHYFVKTHHPPHQQYFTGEKVVQIIRNPGAVLWSYYNFTRDIENNNDNSLVDFINGNVGYGSWTEYHRNWRTTADRLNNKHLLLAYEDIDADAMSACERLSLFIGQPVLRRESKSFEYYHKLRPALARTGRASGWETHYSQPELTTLWTEHGEMMQAFGYDQPRYIYNGKEA